MYKTSNKSTKIDYFNSKRLSTIYLPSGQVGKVADLIMIGRSMKIIDWTKHTKGSSWVKTMGLLSGCISPSDFKQLLGESNDISSRVHATL